MTPVGIEREAVSAHWWLGWGWLCLGCRGQFACEYNFSAGWGTADNVPG